MERSLIRISPENFVSVALLSGAAYLGVIGMTALVRFARSRAGM